MSYKDKPIYSYSFAYAQAAKEEDEFTDSVKLNEKCRDFIEATFESSYRWNNDSPVVCTFDAEAAAKAVIEQFGLQRTVLVVVNTIVARNYDGRISRENKQWAYRWPVFLDQVEGGPYYGTSFVVNRPHSCMFNAFASAVRQIHTNN